MLVCPQCSKYFGDIVNHLIFCKEVDLEPLCRAFVLTSEEKAFIISSRQRKK